MGPQSKEKTIKLKVFLIISVLLILLLPILFEIFAKVGITDKSLNSIIFKTFGIENKTDKEFVEFLNVGQGDCTIIKSGEHAILIDCGLEDENLKVYKRLLTLGIKKVDLVVITHHHKDHMGGFEGIIKNVPVDNLLINGSSAEDADQEIYSKVISLAKENKVKIYSPKIGSSFKFGDAVLKVLYTNGESSEENNRSIVTMLSFCGKKILFTGDSEEEIEEYMVENIDFDCDILKMGHHGSATSSSSQFLQKASPRIAIASCGYDNLYNHPSKDAVIRVEQSNIKIYRTDLDKNIRCSFNTENGSFSVLTEREGLK